MRVVDIQLAFPMLLLAITVIAVFGSGIPILIFVFVLAGWVRYVRVIRAQTLVLKEAQFVEAARSIGANHWDIIRRHISPIRTRPSPVRPSAWMDGSSTTWAGFTCR